MNRRQELATLGGGSFARSPSPPFLDEPLERAPRFSHVGLQLWIGVTPSVYNELIVPGGAFTLANSLSDTGLLQSPDYVGRRWLNGPWTKVVENRLILPACRAKQHPREQMVEAREAERIGQAIEPPEGLGAISADQREVCPGDGSSVLGPRSKCRIRGLESE